MERLHEAAGRAERKRNMGDAHVRVGRRMRVIVESEESEGESSGCA